MSPNLSCSRTRYAPTILPPSVRLPALQLKLDCVPPRVSPEHHTDAQHLQEAPHPVFDDLLTGGVPRPRLAVARSGLNAVVIFRAPHELGCQLCHSPDGVVREFP